MNAKNLIIFCIFYFFGTIIVNLNTNYNTSDRTLPRSNY